MNAIMSEVDQIALCLSGGGYRAALFHLGALRRLNELGVLSKVTLISSVSGGSILAAHLATHMRPWPEPGEKYLQWPEIEANFLKIVKRDIRTGPVLKRLLMPWNWFRSSTQVEALESNYASGLTQLALSELPERPQFVFCATDMVNGVLWKFDRNETGSYVAGYSKPPSDWKLAKAVAASSCFPPVFSPLPLNLTDQYKKGTNDSWRHMCVSDGGLYDNLGLEPSKGYTVLVSDGGAPFYPTAPTGLLGRGKAYLSVMSRQAESVRKRWLISQFVQKERVGTYWGIGSAVCKYREGDTDGYSVALATETIARIRTDMDVFSNAEIAVLCNHGYLLADIAVDVHVAELSTAGIKKDIPYPDWMEEGKVSVALKDSSKMKWLGRGS
jgi:NTE family protein